MCATYPAVAFLDATCGRGTLSCSLCFLAPQVSSARKPCLPCPSPGPALGLFQGLPATFVAGHMPAAPSVDPAPKLEVRGPYILL